MGSRARSCFFCSAHDVGSLCVLAGPQPPCLQLWTTLPSPARDTCHRQGCAGRRPARPLDQHCSDFAHQSPRLLREGRVRFGRTAVEPGNLHFRPTPRDADAAGPPLEQGSPCACFWGGGQGGRWGLDQEHDCRVLELAGFIVTEHSHSPMAVLCLGPHGGPSPAASLGRPPDSPSSPRCDQGGRLKLQLPVANTSLPTPRAELAPGRLVPALCASPRPLSEKGSLSATENARS